MDNEDNMEKRVRQYIIARDKLKEIETKYEQDRKPYLEAQELLSGMIMSFLDKHNMTSLKTTAGTCSTSTKYSASLADPDAFMQHVIQSQAFDLLDRKANVTSVREYVKANKTLPPGVNLSARTTVSVRRPSDKVE